MTLRGSDFLDATPKYWFFKEGIDKLEFIKMRNCSVKDNVRRMRRQATDLKEKYL